MKHTRNPSIFFLAFALLSLGSARATPQANEASHWRVGVARADITPDRPIRMAGYAGRKKPSQGTVEPIFAKAIAFEDGQGKRAVMVTKQTPLHGPLQTSMSTVDLEFTSKDRAPFPYPVQIIQFGKDLSLITLGTEVVVDYSLRLKRELAGRGPAIWVAGYSNAYSGYIPSKRVLLEGGYEAKSRPWKPELEERIIATTHELFDRFNPK